MTRTIVDIPLRCRGGRSEGLPHAHGSGGDDEVWDRRGCVDSRTEFAMRAGRLANVGWSREIGVENKFNALCFCCVELVLLHGIPGLGPSRELVLQRVLQTTSCSCSWGMISALNMQMQVKVSPRIDGNSGTCSL